jgi:hypothetical protein
LFRARLSNQLDLRHPLIRLAGLIDWESFEIDFGARYHETLGRPGKPTRLMVGLTYLKHSYDLSDEQVCERWLENPYWQVFCGFDYLQHRLPIEPSSLTRWRERIGASGMKRLLAVTMRPRLLKIAARITEAASRVRIAFAAACRSVPQYRPKKSLAQRGPIYNNRPTRRRSSKPRPLTCYT